MAPGHLHPDTVLDLHIPFHQGQYAPVHQRPVVLGPVCGLHGAVIVQGVFPFALLNDVLRIGKRRNDPAVAVRPRRAPRVVEMQVAQDDEIDVFRGYAPGRQRLQDGGTRHPVDTPVPVGHLVAVTRVHQDEPAVLPDEEAVGVVGDPVQVVGRTDLLPERLRNDAEHAPAVQLEYAAADHR